MTNRQRPVIMPIFIPHMGCPHHCVFCNQTSITGVSPRVSRGSMAELVNEISEKVALRCSGLHSQTFQGPLKHQWRDQRQKPSRRQLAFYGGSFTAMAENAQIELLSAAHSLIRKRLIDSVRVSTRPDYIDPQTLDRLKSHGVMTVEVGVQSMVDEVLRRSKRGHTAHDVLKAVELLHGRGFEVGVQIMVGLPGDDAHRNAHTVDQIIQLNPHFVRIYPTVVLKGTLLEKWYRSGRYTPLSLREAVDLCKRAFLKFHRAGISVVRLGLQSSPELETEDCVVAGPYHSAFRHLVESSLFYDMASLLMAKIRRSPVVRAKVSPSDLSNIRGQKNENLRQLRERFGLGDFEIEVDQQQPRGSLVLTNGEKRAGISYETLPIS